MKATRALVAALLAVVFAAFGSAIASATETALISPSLTTGTGSDLTLSNDAIDIICDLNLAATLLSSAVLELDELTKVGAVTAGTATNCGELNEVTLLRLPAVLPRPADPTREWEIAVLLPLPTGPGEIANLRILNAQINVFVGSVGINCLYSGNLLATLVDTETPADGLGDRLIFDPADNELDLNPTSDFLCGALGGPTGTLAGTIIVNPEVSVTLL